MKNIKIIYRALLFVSVIILAACEDFMTTPPVDRLTSDGFYQTAPQSEQGVLGVYAGLRDMHNLEYWYLSEIRSDNFWVNPQPDGFREYSELGTFRADEELSTFNDTWNRWYKVIYDANVALTKIPDADFKGQDAFKNQLLGEVHFLRGWAYFELARLFGNIPIIDRPMAPSDVANVPQSTAKEVYDKMVIPDLKEAKRLLPLDKDMIDGANKKIPGIRADQMAATAMLGRVYMTMAGFPVNDASAQALAETELKAVIDFSEANANKYWAPDSTEWQQQWMAEGNNKYSVFAIQYRSGGRGNSAIFNMGLSVPPSYTSRGFYNTGAIHVEKSLMYEFEKRFADNKRDARGDGHSILTWYAAEPAVGTPFPYDNTITLLDLTDATSPMVHSKTMFYKYVNSKHKRALLGQTANIETAMKDNYDWPVNYPVIRYEDILLLYAEILVAKGDAPGAMAIVNRIRTRMGCPAETASSAAEALAFVKRERRIEFLGEGIRWFDLVRWNEWKEAQITKVKRYNNPAGTNVDNFLDGRHLCPIPLNQDNVKPGFYTQNEGYK